MLGSALAYKDQDHDGTCNSNIVSFAHLQPSTKVTSYWRNPTSPQEAKTKWADFFQNPIQTLWDSAICPFCSWSHMLCLHHLIFQHLHQYLQFKTFEQNFCANTAHKTIQGQAIKTSPPFYSGIIVCELQYLCWKFRNMPLLSKSRYHNLKGGAKSEWCTTRQNMISGSCVTFAVSQTQHRFYTVSEQNNSGKLDRTKHK